MDGSNYFGCCGGDLEVVVVLIWSWLCVFYIINWIDIVGYVYVELCFVFFDFYRICMRVGEVWGSIFLCVDDVVFFVCVVVDVWFDWVMVGIGWNFYYNGYEYVWRCIGCSMI